MGSRFHSTDNRPSTCFSSPPKFPASNSNFSYFTHDAIAAGFTGVESSRREYFRYPSPYRMQESFRRELEKERIRAEIIAEEVYRRRILEEEVRSEMMVEREMALRRGEREIRIGASSLSMHGKTRVPLLTNIEHRTAVSPYWKSGSETLPFQRDHAVAEKGDDYSNASSSSVNLKNFDLEAKPGATYLKRKASKPPIGATVNPSTGSKKPKIQEWSCALCHVTATSEQALNDHLRGKKHKARQSGLNTQRIGFGTGPLPNTVTSTAKPTMVPGARSTNTKSSRKKNAKAGAEASVGKFEKIDIPKKTSATGSRKKNAKAVAEASVVKVEKTDIPKKISASANPGNIMKFLCEICQVRTHSLKVMNAHKKGKPHLAKVKKLEKKVEAAPASGETTPALKVIVENKKPDNAASVSVEKGVVEENKKHYVDAVKESSNNEMPAQGDVVKVVDAAKESSNNGMLAQRGMVKPVKKEDNKLQMDAAVDKDVGEEKKELYIGGAGEIKKEIGEELESSNKEGADFDVTGVEVVQVTWNFY